MDQLKRPLNNKSLLTPTKLYALGLKKQQQKKKTEGVDKAY